MTGLEARGNSRFHPALGSGPGGRDPAIPLAVSVAGPGAPDLAWDEPAYFLRLGPPFRPNHEVRTGTGIFRAAPLTADLDLLLTCATISEARDATKARRAGSST